ncbi:hypothetical protein GUITHDRAFT_118043 [Guillardia theta CCMP2712]|uniref:Uncharacterized protein n=1 Tax=Guillardia theta (strain CCMP2712) TaxID=905079 RepID=L1IHR0_GUITC|nr:hypothetical protein GUITHDRAFT_118043 [Guillardia theta CCMP2712]EKX35768.1 hypothetical protein GUITHDRAFT_118043 [Guillardia theta CCMP2712]|eukprot:XP_005822748.1 hypothetical protein GUITHDRAFT_118043 [Guillardia theta CCMP2712]
MAVNAGIAGANADQELDEKKAKGLAAKAMKMKEDITNEVCRRVARMQDREEKAVLMTAIKALKNSDPERSLHVLSERLKQLARRMEARGEDSSDEEEEAEEAKEAAETSIEAHAQHESQGEQWWRSETRPDKWSEVVDHVLAVSCSLSSLSRGEDSWIEEADIVPLRESLLGKGMRSLRRAGVPTFYIWMYDEPWKVMLRLWEAAEKLIGGPCVLEPTFAAYHLDYHKAGESGNRYVGTNFSLPHRDYTYSDSYDSSGQPKVVTIWVPVSDVTLENGCMYVVPKEFDANFDRDDVMQHMWVQCHRTCSSNPRASIAWVFKRADTSHSLDSSPISFEDAQQLTLEQRKGLIESSMDYFKHWSSPRT